MYNHPYQDVLDITTALCWDFRITAAAVFNTAAGLVCVCRRTCHWRTTRGFCLKHTHSVSSSSYPHIFKYKSFAGYTKGWKDNART